MKFRVIFDEHRDGITNMCIDEYFLKKQLPTIRFYQFSNSITIGKNCNLDSIKLSKCREKNIDIAKRSSGGNIVYHDETDFTYSITAPNKLFKMEKGQLYNKQAYTTICNWILKALHQFLPECKINGNNILLNGKKVCGNSQICKEDYFLQHGSIFFNDDGRKWLELIDFDSNLIEHIIGLKKHKIDFNKFRDAMAKEFVKNEIVSDIRIMPITKAEWIEINKMIKEKESEEFIGLKKSICAIDHISNIK